MVPYPELISINGTFIQFVELCQVENVQLLKKGADKIDGGMGPYFKSFIGDRIFSSYRVQGFHLIYDGVCLFFYTA